MRNPRSALSIAKQLIAVLVAVCLLLDPILVSLHLAQHDHSEPLTSGARAHGHHHGSGHAHGHHHHGDHHHHDAPEPAGDPDHPPHPASDHDGPCHVGPSPGGPLLTDGGRTPAPLCLARPIEPLDLARVRREAPRIRPPTGPPRVDHQTALRAATLLLL